MASLADHIGDNIDFNTLKNVSTSFRMTNAPFRERCKFYHPQIYKSLLEERHCLNQYCLTYQKEQFVTYFEINKIHSNAKAVKILKKMIYMGSKEDGENNQRKK